MDELESQIAKIQLGNAKTSSSYVFTMAEKAPVGRAELYVVAEMPLFNPAAEEECERICMAIASTLKRSYRKNNNENSFENAISQINDELGKLASLGETHWIDKLNCILGVKEDDNFSVASCGKVSAFLLRNSEYTDISCSPAKSHPLKTFENYATGKIRLGDLLILSTTQLFNYLSMDRLLKIVSGTDFLTATKTIIELLKENSEPRVSFGVLLNLQVPLGQTNEQEDDLENYIVEKPAPKSLVSNAFNYAKTAFGMDKGPKRTPQVNLPKISMAQRLENLKSGTKTFASKSKGWLQTAKTSAQNVKSTVSPQNLRSMPTQKKFFLISLVVLLIAVIFSIKVAASLKKTGTQHAQINSELKTAQSLLSNAQSSLLYKDDASAANFLQQAKTNIPAANKIDSGDKTLYNQVLAQLSDTQKLMEKVFTPQVANLGSLGAGNNLIKLPNYAAVQVNQAIVSYNKTNSQVEDGALTAPVTILSSVYLTKTSVAVYDGSQLYQWDFSTGKTAAGFSQDVPQTADFGGLAQYPTNSRIYLVDKKQGSVISFAPLKNSFSKPVVAVNSPSLSQAMDIAIDGSIYVLTPSGIVKFQSGQPAPFSLNLPTPFSGTGKIYTEKDFNYLYLLDSGNNSILILDKKGSLINTLKSDQFTKLKDFQVDEKNKVIYVLNDGSLLKVSLP